jgi:energy-coupling factor transporter ATP-binding protein EcfA2
MYRLPEVKAAIASLAGLRSIETSLLGAGAWQIDNAMVLVGPGECAILNGKGVFEQQLTPEYGDHVFDLRSDGKWFDLKYLNELLPMAQDQFWRAEIVQHMDSIFRMWNFKAGDAVPKLMTGLVLATWVQSIWNWRPQVFVYGESGCGKTTLFQLLSGQSPDAREGIFGGLAVSSSDYTASAIRQTIGKTSKVVILDEMENSKNRKEFLTLARGAGRGATQLRGTTYHRTVATRLAQIFWCASTETGLDREMDQNRFVVIEMLKGTSRTIRMPANLEVHQLGQKLLVSMIVAAERAIELEKFLATRPIPNIPGRIVESYAVPAAAYAAVCGMTDEEAVAHLVSLLGGAFEEDSVESDASALMSDIMNSQIEIGRGERMLVSQVVEMWRDEEAKIVGEGGFTSSCETKFKDALILQGMRVCYRDEKAAKTSSTEVGLFIAHRNVRNGLLKNTDWATQRLDQKLTRVKGAVKIKKKIAGTLPSGVWVPCSFCLPSHQTDE